MSIRRRSTPLLLATSFVLLGADLCFACSCALSSPRELAANASAVFTGTVVKIDERSEPDPYAVPEDPQPRALPVRVVRFSVETAYKGSVTSEMDVRTAVDSAACGFEFVNGWRYTVFTYETDGAVWTGLCSGTTEGEVEPARYELSVQPVDPGGPVLEGTGEPLVAVDVPAPPVAWAWVTVFLLTAGAAWVLATRRRPG